MRFALFFGGAAITMQASPSRASDKKTGARDAHLCEGLCYCGSAEHRVEPSGEPGERVAAPIMCAGESEGVLVFELERACRTAGSFDLDLAMSSVEHEPEIGAAGFIPEPARVASLDIHAGLCFQEGDNGVLYLFFGGHKNFPFRFRGFTVFCGKVTL